MRCLVAMSPEMLAADWCREFLLRRWYPLGPLCPRCGASLSRVQELSFRLGERVHCKNCGGWSTWRTGTPLHGSTADERQVVLFFLLATLGCAPSVIAEACGLSTDTIRAWRERWAAS